MLFRSFFSFVSCSATIRISGSPVGQHRSRRVISGSRAHSILKVLSGGRMCAIYAGNDSQNTYLSSPGRIICNSRALALAWSVPSTCPLWNGLGLVGLVTVASCNAMIVSILLCVVVMSGVELRQTVWCKHSEPAPIPPKAVRLVSQRAEGRGKKKRRTRDTWQAPGPIKWPSRSPPRPPPSNSWPRLVAVEGSRLASLTARKSPSPHSMQNANSQTSWSRGHDWLSAVGPCNC